jgi:hypothetical protein
MTLNKYGISVELVAQRKAGTQAYLKRLADLDSPFNCKAERLKRANKSCKVSKAEAIDTKAKADDVLANLVNLSN